MKFFDWLKSIRVRRQRDLNYPSGRRKTIPLRIHENAHQNTTTPQRYTQKRRYKRYIVEGMEIHTKMIFSEMIELSNISIGGACIITTKDLKPDDNLIIRIKDKNINEPLKCTVIWENEAGDKNKKKEGIVILNKAGVKFKEVKPDTLIKLKDYMRESGIPEEEKLREEYKSSALRFKVYKNEKAIMSYPVSYPVKKISLGGMLVEAGHKFKIEQRYPLAIYLPQGTLPIKIHGRIASLIPIPDEKKNRYDIGIEFLNLSGNDKSKLNRLFSQL